MKIKIYALIIVSCFIILAISSCVNAESLTVTVKDKKGNPISNAFVKVKHWNTNDWGYTGSDGIYVTSDFNVDLEWVTVIVKKSGYQRFSDRYNFFGGSPYQDNRVDVELEKINGHSKQLIYNPFMSFLDSFPFLQRFLKL